MANNLNSNITRKLIRKFIPAIEKQRVLSKTVDNQTYIGINGFDPASGDTIDIKRPHQYRAVETADGDLSSSTDNSITAGNATATVQNFITVKVPFSIYEQALQLDQLDDIVNPAAEECVTRLETNLGLFMTKNAGLTAGDPDTVVDAWSDVASPMALMQSIGVPAGKKYYAVNPFIMNNLASAQSGLSPASGTLVNTAWQQAQISTPFAGYNTIATNSLPNFASGAAADRDGTLAATPDATYLTAKDTMRQSLSLTGLTVSTTGALKAGDVLEFTGTGADARSYIHQKTRQVFTDETGAPVKWRCTVLADADTDSSGDATVTVSGPALKETNGQYDTVSSALTSGDVFTIIGTASKIYQPNLFYHEMAFSVAYVKLPTLYSTDSRATTSEGLSVRVSKYSDGDANKQSIRFDLLPAFACHNPFYSGKGFGK